MANTARLAMILEQEERRRGRGSEGEGGGRCELCGRRRQPPGCQATVLEIERIAATVARARGPSSEHSMADRRVACLMLVEHRGKFPV